MARTYVWSKCPYCNKTLSVRSHQGTLPESKIGVTEFTICPNCHKKVSNGKKEWPEMTSSEKASEVFLFIISDLFSTVIFGTIIGFLIFKLFNYDSITSLALCVSLTAAVLVLLFILANKRIVNNSVKRYLSKQEEISSPEGQFKLSLENNFEIIQIVDIVKNLKEKAASNLVLISKYIKIVKDKEEVILGDFKEKDNLNKLEIYYDKLLSLLSYYFFKGFMYYYFKEIYNKSINEEVNSFNQQLIDLLHKYLPEDKTEDEIKETFPFLGEFINKKNTYLSNLKNDMLNMGSTINYEQLKKYTSFITLEMQLDIVLNEYDNFVKTLIV